MSDCPFPTTETTVHNFPHLTSVVTENEYCTSGNKAKDNNERVSLFKEASRALLAAGEGNVEAAQIETNVELLRVFNFAYLSRESGLDFLPPTWVDIDMCVGDFPAIVCYHEPLWTVFFTG